jgi:hypothetical protein
MRPPPRIEETTMGRRLQDRHLGARAAVAGVLTAAEPALGADDDDSFDFDVEPYGPVEADEASWFVPADRGAHAARRDEREALALVERLLGT